MVGLMETKIDYYPINSRTKVSVDIGTIKYYGEIKGYPGEWVGIEWDNPDRGKHNGSINGQQLFTTKYPTSGSFIRPEKLLSAMPLEHVIKEKYILLDENPLDDDLMRETQEHLHASVFEIVGMKKLIDKQCKIETLVDICAANSLTSSAGDISALKNLVQLNLTSTLIWNWSIVADIVKQVPSLRYLNLAQNSIVPPKLSQIDLLEPHFRHLKNLSLGHCGLKNWEDILYIAKLWPFIEELGLQGNEICKISPTNDDVVFKNLRVLDLHRNKLSDFAQIINLGQIQSLENLLLMENGISRIELPDVDPTKRLEICTSLLALNLRDNPIADEHLAFNELDKLEKLEVLSISPHDTYEEMVSKAVALIPNLKVLNKAVITSDQRRGGHYDLWKMFGLKWINSEDNPSARLSLIKMCRVYPQLIAKYGIPEVMVNPVKKSGLITIKILESKTNRVIQKKVPLKITIQTFQGIVLKLFKPENMELPRLSYVDKNLASIRVEMDNLSKTMDYYSIQDGDTVIFE